MRPSTRQKHVHVRLILRKSLKRQSKRAKYRKRNNKSTSAARSLVTSNLINQSARLIHVSVFRNPTLSVEKSLKNKNNKKKNSIIDQQQISNNNIQSLKHNQTNNSKHTIPVIDTAEKIHCIKPNDYNDQHLTILKSSSHPFNNINSTTDKKVLSTSHILSSNQTPHLLLHSLHESNINNINPLHDTTVKLSSSLIHKRFSELIRFNKKSSVHPNDEKKDESSSEIKKRRLLPPWILLLMSILLVLLICGIIIAIVIPLTTRKETTTVDSTTVSTNTIVLTTTPTPICTTINYTACATVMYNNWHMGSVPQLQYAYVSCCYVAPVVSQLTIQFALQEDAGGFWMLDDIDATQGYGELITNGGFEYNMTNWTMTVSSNATASSVIADFQGIYQHSGNAFLKGVSAGGSTYVKQTFSIIQGQNVLINFWWFYESPFGGATGPCELTVTLT